MSHVKKTRPCGSTETLCLGFRRSKYNVKSLFLERSSGNTTVILKKLAIDTLLRPYTLKFMGQQLERERACARGCSKAEAAISRPNVTTAALTNGAAEVTTQCLKEKKISMESLKSILKRRQFLVRLLFSDNMNCSKSNLSSASIIKPCNSY